MVVFRAHVGVSSLTAPSKSLNKGVPYKDTADNQMLEKGDRKRTLN